MNPGIVQGVDVGEEQGVRVQECAGKQIPYAVLIRFVVLGMIVHDAGVVFSIEFPSFAAVTAIRMGGRRRHASNGLTGRQRSKWHYTPTARNPVFEG